LDSKALARIPPRETRVRQILIPLPALLVLLCGGAAAADERSLDRLLDKLSAVTSYEDVAISPDGKAVAWVQALRNKPDALTPDRKIYVRQLGSDPTAPRPIRAGDGAHEEHAPAWSPDGKWIAFLSDREMEGQPQLYVIAASGKDVRRLTNVKGSLARP